MRSTGKKRNKEGSYSKLTLHVNEMYFFGMHHRHFSPMHLKPFDYKIQKSYHRREVVMVVYRYEFNLYLYAMIHFKTIPSEVVCVVIFLCCQSNPEININKTETVQFEFEEIAFFPSFRHLSVVYSTALINL